MSSPGFAAFFLSFAARAVWTKTNCCNTRYFLPKTLKNDAGSAFKQRARRFPCGAPGRENQVHLDWCDCPNAFRCFLLWERSRKPLWTQPHKSAV
jgi:hypothetical protein